jgi:hypothetical protein
MREARHVGYIGEIVTGQHNVTPAFNVGTIP